MTITVSTDGSALGNPNGPMGWAWADHAKNAGDGGATGHEHDSRGYDAGGATNGTNQIGELCAVLEVLRAHPGSEPLLIESDSQYAINCSTKWVKGWKRNGWKNSQKKPVKNAEIIKAIDEEIARRPGPVDFRWVKGHAGNAGNELVDELARTYAGDCRSGARDGYLPIEGWRSLLKSEYAHGTDVPPDVQLVLDGKADASSLRAPADHTSPSRASGSGKSAASTKPTNSSLVELLAEPEGVPDWGGDGKVDTSKTARSEAPKSTTTEPGTSPISDNAESSMAATSARHGTTRPNAAQTDATEQTFSPQPSGLTVAGTVRFSPAPKTSPYFTGEAMHVHGFIAIDGYVDGDGNLTLTNADFLRG